MNAVHRLTSRNCPLKKGGAHQRGVPMEERMLKLFAYGHLEREDLLAVSKPFAELAERVVAPSVSAAAR